MTRFLIALCVCLPAFSGDSDDAFQEGMRLARMGQWTEAREALLRGRTFAPREKRFALELAGIAVRMGDRQLAIKELHRALALDPHDAYANEALGSLYLLDGRIEAAIIYWNRVGMPRIHDVIVNDRAQPAVEVSPGEVLTEETFLQTSANLERLGFSAPRIDLVPRDADEFDLVIQVAAPTATSRNVPGWARDVASGLPYQTLNLDFRPNHEWLESIDTTLRWDPNKKLVGVRGSGLFAGNPRLRYVLDARARDEDWDLRHTSVAPFHLAATTLTGEIEAGLTGRLQWTNGFGVSAVHYDGAPVAPMFANGLEIKEFSRASYQLLRRPSRRLFISLDGGAEFGRLGSAFGKFQAGARAHWTHGETHAFDVHGAVYSGTSLGQLPFDEAYQLGMSRDNDLWIRGHTAEYDGRKGNAPLGGQFLLTQLDGLKSLYQNGFVRWEIGPFVDSGQVAGSLGSHGWLLDAGVESHLRVLKSVTFVAIYGRDTLHGGGVIFTAIRTAN